MAQYILESNKFTAITETEGTLVNISNVPAEISLSEEFGTGIILFPHQQLAFAKVVYAARAPGSYGRAIVAAIGTGGLQAESFTYEDIAAVFDDDTETSGETFTDEDIEKVFEDDESFTDEDVAEIFNGDETELEGGFTDDDLKEVFNDDNFDDESSFTQNDIDSIFAA